MTVATAAQIAARPIQGMGNKQVPIKTPANNKTVAATETPQTPNKPAIETATNKGFFQRNGAR